MNGSSWKKEWKRSYRERLIENKDKHSEFHRWMMQSITGTTRTACSSVLPAFVLPALCVFLQKRYLWWDSLIFNQIKKNRPADSCTGVGGPGGNGKQHSPTREKPKHLTGCLGVLCNGYFISLCISIYGRKFWLLWSRNVKQRWIRRVAAAQTIISWVLTIPRHILINIF